MMFSTRSEYGVRVMIAARAPARRGPGPAGRDRRGRERCRSPTSSSWCRACARPSSCRSTRGAHGGYELARDPAEITMAEVVHALEETIVPMQCFERARRRRRVLCNHELRRLRELRHEAAVDPRAGRRRAGARADDARGAGEFAEQRRRRRASRRSGTGAARAAPRAHDHLNEHRRSEPSPMADLEIQNLHVNVEGKEILQGRRPDGRRAARCTR